MEFVDGRESRPGRWHFRFRFIASNTDFFELSRSTLAGPLPLARRAGKHL
jgi:hypothetical protein